MSRDSSDPLVFAEATAADMPAIAECLRRFKLDDEDLVAGQFLLLRQRGEMVAFGRIKPYGGVYELCSVGVLEDARGRGLGARMVRELIRRFPSDEVYITTDIPEYFERFGFRRIEDGPEPIFRKLRDVCGRLRSGAVAMLGARTPRL